MITDFRDFCLLCYVLIDDCLRELAPKLGLKPGPPSECSDSELITMAIVGECREWNKETTLLANWQLFPDLFPVVPSRTRFNRRRRALGSVINLLRRLLLSQLDLGFDQLGVMDSLPVPVLNFHLVPRSRNDWQAYGAAFGHISSKKQTIFGYKLHLLITANGLITDFVLTGANTDDRQVALQMLSEYSNLTVLADKAYISEPIAHFLEQNQQLKLLTLPRSNQKKTVTPQQQKLHNHFRQIIETVNSQLSEQLALEENYAHSFAGLASRLITKLTAHTLSIYLNWQLGQANFLQIKALAFPELL